MPCNICPVETTLDLIGGKYKALIIWHLTDRKLRFSELRRLITSATPKMLTQQLRELEAQELVHREVYPVIPPKVEYSLTEKGKSVVPILQSICNWAGLFYKDDDDGGIPMIQCRKCDHRG